ncbi:DUF368 domain-containing protein [Anditalea andensis]|uniref:Membrane protein n=1 Tax=Anditalea andensis TaxID=1048983 RepID=A0A074KX22_9BACT|nr:DUF368 domain-containing protein [Anditalea andensis]KEO72118.1 membrane protein [Anditalea andensis]
MTYWKKFILTYFKGVGMGGADLVPGVSGGSIALITGIYEELLDSIKSIDLAALRLLISGRFKMFWTAVNGNFLLAVFLGIFTSLFTLSRLLTYLIENQPIPLWGFFCGLILISAIWILRDVPIWNTVTLLAVAIGIVLAYYITELPPISSPESPLYTFISGAIAICAMILPGISGSFILLILGQYEPILQALNDRNLLTLFLFGLGCLVGLLAFSHLISYLLHHYKAATLAFLAGIMLGSINKIWPWKNVLSYRMSSAGVEKPFLTENVMPGTYANMTGEDPQIMVAAITFILGFLLVILIERTANYFKK